MNSLQQLKLAGVLGAGIVAFIAVVGAAEVREREQNGYAEDLRLNITRFDKAFQGSTPFGSGWTGNVTAMLAVRLPATWQGPGGCGSTARATPWGGGCWDANFDGTAYVFRASGMSQYLCTALWEQLPGNSRLRWINAGPGITSYTAGIDINTIAPHLVAGTANDQTVRCTGANNTMIFAFQ
jgi:hypothetical protein